MAARSVVAAGAVGWRILGALLLAVTAAVHLWLWPSHAGLVPEAMAHPKPPPTTPANAPATTDLLRVGQGRPEPVTLAPSAPAPAEPLPASTFYVGWLFLAGAAVSAVAARHVAADRLGWGWGLGAAVCLAMTAGLLAARTVGLPGGYREGGSPEGHVTLAVQLAFLALAAGRLGQVRSARWG